MRFVVAIDKFKGSATSEQLSRTIENAILETLPTAQVEIVAVADGGDGTMHAISHLIGTKAIVHTVEVPAPLKHLAPVEAQYLIDGDTAYMDLATASGLALVPMSLRDVMHASTLGSGMMIADAVKHGARHIVMGLGGSATCDGAMGILAALGCKFFDRNNHILDPCGGNLSEIEQIDTQGISEQVRAVRFTLLTDVDNPLLGNNGAAAIFAPQKGASPQQVVMLENGLVNLARFMPRGVALAPGAGAAGGVAAGMMAFLNATVTSGINYVLEMAHFDEMVAHAHMVITGEGRIDEQTAMGKAPAGVLRVARRWNVPVIALCGSIAPDVDAARFGFSAIIPVTPEDMPLKQAMNTATTLNNVDNAIRDLINSWE